jgi:sugar phosphate isomerase/epimerase
LAAGAIPLASMAATDPKSWPIGCFNRPWTKWGYDASLDGIKAAGYGLTGLLTTTKDEPFTTSPATPEYLDALKKKIAARNLAVNMTALRLRTTLPLADAIADTRRQLDNAHLVGVQFALTFGVAKPEEYPLFYKLMADAAAYAQDKGIQLAMKPHGGGSGSSEEILHCIKEVNHPNFKIWYDAGNIIYYTGKDPLAELEPIVQHVTGFCAKDCASEKGDVMIQFGAGKVYFAAVFRRHNAAGFNGPIMVDC